MKRRTLWLLAGVFATGLIAAGCGGDDDDDGGGGATAAEPLTKQEYIAQGDQICREADQELDDAGEAAFGEEGPSSAEALENFISDEVAPNVQGQIDDLRELSPPEGDEDTVNEIYDAADEGIQQLEDDPSSFTDEEGPQPLAEASRLARDYGFKVCGEE